MFSRHTVSVILAGLSVLALASLAVAQDPAYQSLPTVYPITPAPSEVLQPPPPDMPVAPQSPAQLSYEEAFAPTWYQPAYWFGQTSWDRSMEVGINGSDGTSESMSMRVGGTLHRKTDWNKFDLDIIYNQTSSNGTQTQNNGLLDARHDWFLGESPWTLFISTSVLYDEFQAFDLRFAANSGVGYQFIETNRANLIGRFGAGTSREFGGPDKRWVPEAIFGAEHSFNINEVQKIVAKIDYLPDWADFSNYRMVSDIGWELLLDAETNLSLKLSVTDRYDSTPNGAEPHLLNYGVLLLWKL